jgi:hypothetical protein
MNFRARGELAARLFYLQSCITCFYVEFFWPNICQHCHIMEAGQPPLGPGSKREEYPICP